MGEILRGWEGESRIFRPGLEPGDGPTPETGHETDGVVLMGSAASVHEPQPWIEPLGAWLGPLLSGEREVPLLGICFGHQMLAHLAGGRVDFLRPDRSKMLGVEPTRLVGSRLLADRTLQVVVSHREAVVDPPPGYAVTASRPSTSVDGLEHARLPIFSYQFHPEAREEFAERSGFDPVLIDRRVREDSQLLMGAFRRLAVRRCRRAAS